MTRYRSLYVNSLTDDLLYEIQNIAALIYYQCSLRDQDRWLHRIMEKGIWMPEETDGGGTYYMSVEETLKNMKDKDESK